jgi:hypothetical protein
MIFILVTSPMGEGDALYLFLCIKPKQILYFPLINNGKEYDQLMETLMVQNLMV